jgi:rRNA maturation endonuclease Nob1
MNTMKECAEALHKLELAVRLKDLNVLDEDVIGPLNMAITAFENGIRPDYQGEWKLITHVKRDLIICSRCKKEYDLPDEYWNYCPNCGDRKTEGEYNE